jgi:hypothetical protein
MKLPTFHDERVPDLPAGEHDPDLCGFLIHVIQDPEIAQP